MSGLTSRQPSRVSATPASRGNGSAARGSTNGARVIDSVPPAKQTSASPAAMARAASAIASIPDPQSRLTVAPGICTGSPASSTPIRATFLLSSPAWLAAPQYTSSICAGSSQELRVISARITSAVRWSGRTPASDPLILPTGVRQASTANTALIGNRPSWMDVPSLGLLPAQRYVHRPSAPRGRTGGRVPGDVRGQRAQCGQRVQVEILGRHVHAEPPVHLAQQQRAGQRVEPHARAEQRGLLAQAEQFRPSGRPGQDLPQFGDDLRSPV